MEINEQLFEDVLSGKLKGVFVLRNKVTYSSDELIRDTTNGDKYTYPYSIKNWSYTPSGMYHLYDKSNIDIIDFIPDTDMKQNELTIEIPEGKEIDWKQSEKENKIVLKDKQLTYEDVCKKLFEDDHYTITLAGYPIKCCSAIYNANNAPTEHQLNCILAKNMLANTAKYLNDGWKPSKGDYVFVIVYVGNFDNELSIEELYFNSGEYLVLFKTQELAQQAIEILGEETVKLALEPLGF